MVMVRSLEPQEMADVSVQMCSPSTAGMYQGQWRMCTATGLYYGGEQPLSQPTSPLGTAGTLQADNGAGGQRSASPGPKYRTRSGGKHQESCFVVLVSVFEHW